MWRFPLLCHTEAETGGPTPRSRQRLEFDWLVWSSRKLQPFDQLELGLKPSFGQFDWVSTSHGQRAPQNQIVNDIIGYRTDHKSWLASRKPQDKRRSLQNHGHTTPTQALTDGPPELTPSMSSTMRRATFFPMSAFVSMVEIKASIPDV